jgi:hypothetical protein
MTPEEAAVLLRVRTDASAPDIERAFRARARALHPDRLTDATPGQLADAANRFARISTAHEVLMREAAERPIEAVIEPDRPEAPPTGRWLIIAWLFVLLVAGAISYFGGILPYSRADILLRLLPLAASATAFALTGRRGFLVLTLVFTGASAVLTLALASFGSLVALGLLLVPVLGLVTVGRHRLVRA